MWITFPARAEAVCHHIQHSSGATASYFCLMTFSVSNTNLTSRTIFQFYIRYWFSVIFFTVFACLLRLQVLSSSASPPFPITFPTSFRVSLLFFFRWPFQYSLSIPQWKAYLCVLLNTWKIMTIKYMFVDYIKVSYKPTNCRTGEKSNVSFNVTCTCRNLNPAPHHEER